MIFYFNEWNQLNIDLPFFIAVGLQKQNNFYEKSDKTRKSISCVLISQQFNNLKSTGTKRQKWWLLFHQKYPGALSLLYS